MDYISAVRTDMNEFTAVFDSWAQKLTSDLHQQHSAHQLAVKEAVEEIEQLRHQQQTLAHSHSTLKKECEDESRSVARLQELLTALQKEATRLPDGIDALRQRHSQAIVYAETQQTLLADVERRCDEELSAVQKQLIPFQKALGLSFIPKTNELQVVFTRISRALPSRPFTLSVCVNPSNEYEIHSCSPAVASLPALLAELNHPQDGDFARFLFKVRREFQRIALE